MLRTLLALSLAILPATAAAQTRTVTCPDARPGDATCDGFTLSGSGSVSASVFTTAADLHGLALYSPTDFTLFSAMFRSVTASPNTVVLLGYKRNVIDVPFSGFPYPGRYGPFSYQAIFNVGANGFTFHAFNWTDLAAIRFDGSGGPTPGAPIPIHDSFDYRISSVVVSATTTPEPASIVLVASGLLGIVGLTRRRTIAARGRQDAS